MQELAVFSSNVPSFSPDFLARMKQAQAEDFAGLGSGLRFIRPRKADFLLIDGGTQEVVGGSSLVGVLIAAAPYPHCVWYAKEYAPGQEPEGPDLIWIQHTPGEVPDALPPQFRQKIMKNGKERLAYQIRRRTVWALLRPQGNGQFSFDLEKPYVLDLTSMSLFGKSRPEANAYTYKGLRDVCLQFSNSAMTVSPSMFVSQIVPNLAETVTGVVNFCPMRSQDGMLQFLDPNIIMKVFDARERDDVKDILNVQEKLTLGDAPAKPAQPAPQTFSAPTYVNPQPPVQPAPQPAPAPKPADNSAASLLAQAQSVLQAAGVQSANTIPPVQTPPQKPYTEPGIVETEGPVSDSTRKAFSQLLHDIA